MTYPPTLVDEIAEAMIGLPLDECDTDTVEAWRASAREALNALDRRHLIGVSMPNPIDDLRQGTFAPAQAVRLNDDGSEHPSDGSLPRPLTEPEPENHSPGLPPIDPGLRRAWERTQQTTSSEATTPHPLGRTVWYRSRTGRWTAPAIITSTHDSLYQPNVDAGHVPPISDPGSVHLTVLTPGTPGEISAETAAEQPTLADPDRVNAPTGGTFQEWDIPKWDSGDLDPAAFEFDMQPPGTWMWPL